MDQLSGKMRKARESTTGKRKEKKKIEAKLANRKGNRRKSNREESEAAQRVLLRGKGTRAHRSCSCIRSILINVGFLFSLSLFPSLLCPFYAFSDYKLVSRNRH